MVPDAPEPIGSISIVGFAPVHDRMDQRAIGSLDALRERMGGAEMIMPKENQRSNQLLLFGIQSNFVEEVIAVTLQGGLRPDALPGPRPQLSRLRGSQ